MAPINAPRIGPDARSQVIGGPAWQNWPGTSPSACDAGSTSTRVARTSSIRRTAAAFAAGRRGSASTAASAPAVPGGSSTGGRKSTGTTGTAWSRSASASRSSPAVITLNPPASRSGTARAGVRAGRDGASVGPGRSSSDGPGWAVTGHLQVRGRRPGRSPHRAAGSDGDARGPGRRLGVGKEHLGAGVDQRRRLGLAVLRVGCRAAQAHHDGQHPAVRRRRVDRRGHRRGQPTGRIRLGTVSEDDVHQEHRDVGVGRLVGQQGEPDRRIDHRMRPAQGECVVAQVDDHVPEAGQPGHAVDDRLRKEARGRGGAGCWIGSHPASRRRRSSLHRPACLRRTGRGAHRARRPPAGPAATSARPAPTPRARPAGRALLR